MRAAWQRLHPVLALSAARITSLRLDRSQRLALVFTPLALAIVATGLLALHSADALAASEHMVSHIYAVQAQIHLVESRLADAEDDLRGYLLTGDSSYLAPYTTDGHALTTEIARLRSLTSGDATAQRRISTLEPMVGPLLAAWQHAIDLRAQQQTNEAISLARSEQVQRTLTSTHALLTAMDEAERNALAAQLRAEASNVTSAHVTILVATAADIALLVALVVLVWHAFIARERHLHMVSAAREAAEEAVAVRDAFLSMASHELRTPIAVLLVNIQLLERHLSRGRWEQDERIRQSFAAIHRQMGRLQALISMLLDVSRIERGQLTIARDPLDLVALVRGVVDELRPSAQAHPIEVVLPVDPSPTITILGDVIRLEQVMLNLLQNAVKYSPEGGSIHVEVRRMADWALVAVTDRGMGISADVLPHVFERFYRAPEAQSEHISGMGIGLYLVREIVALHGGEVTISSEQGTGTTVTVRLPLAVPERPRAEGASEG